jgi:glycine cleavage system transcriptional repressor
MGKKKQATDKLVSVSVMGADRPGIVAGVSKVLYENACNIEALSQTVMMGQFAMIVVVSPLKGSKPEELGKALAVLAREMGLEIHVRLLDSEGRPGFDPGEAEPFVITVRGADRPGFCYHSDPGRAGNQYYPFGGRGGPSGPADGVHPDL